MHTLGVWDTKLSRTCSPPLTSIWNARGEGWGSMTTLYQVLYYISQSASRSRTSRRCVCVCVCVCVFYLFIPTYMHGYIHVHTYLHTYYSWLSKPKVHRQEGRKEGLWPDWNPMSTLFYLKILLHSLPWVSPVLLLAIYLLVKDCVEVGGISLSYTHPFSQIPVGPLF